MAHENRVIHSVNLHGDVICVDVFQRPDGSYGFDEFRRDVEDSRGWFSIGHFGAQRFTSLRAALDAAAAQVEWFEGV